MNRCGRRVTKLRISRRFSSKGGAPNPAARTLGFTRKRKWCAASATRARKAADHQRRCLSKRVSSRTAIIAISVQPIVVHVSDTPWVTIVASGLSAVLGAVVTGRFMLRQSKLQEEDAEEDRKHSARLARRQATASASGQLLQVLLSCDIDLHNGLQAASLLDPLGPSPRADGLLTDAQIERAEFALDAARSLSNVIMTTAPLFPNDDLLGMLSSAVEYSAKIGRVVLTEQPSSKTLTRTRRDVTEYFRYLRWCVGCFAEDASLPVKADAPDPFRSDEKVWVPPLEPPEWA